MKIKNEKNVKNIIEKLGIFRYQDLDFIRVRRNDGLIFFDKKTQKYIRFGFENDIKKEIEKCKLYIGDECFCLGKNIFFLQLVDLYLE